MTTIVGVKKGDEIVIAGDGQVSLGNTVIKGSARKVRRLSPGGRDVIAGCSGSTADAVVLGERLELRLQAAPGQLARAAVGLAEAIAAASASTRCNSFTPSRSRIARDR